MTTVFESSKYKIVARLLSENGIKSVHLQSKCIFHAGVTFCESRYLKKSPRLSAVPGWHREALPDTFFFNFF